MLLFLSVSRPQKKKKKILGANDFYPRSTYTHHHQVPGIKGSVPPQVLCPPALDPHHFAYHANRLREDNTATAFHCALPHLDNANTLARLLFIDFSSACNKVIPNDLICKLQDLGVRTLLSVTGCWASSHKDHSL